MKKFTILFLLCSFLSNIAFGNCDWSTITPGPNHTWIYPDALHLCVGQLVQDSAVKDKQLSDLTQALDLKNAAITASDQRIQLWQKTSDDEQSRLAKLSSEESHSNWLYFSLGVLTVIGSGFMAARLIGR